MTTDLAALEQATELAQMRAEMAALRAETAELRAQRNSDGDGSLEQAIREFEHGRVAPTTFTTKPCQQITASGGLCGRVFNDHLEERLGMNPMPLGHSFRLSPFVPSTMTKPKSFYAKDEPVAVVVPPAEAIEDTYLTVAQTAKQLKIKVAEVRGLIADGQLKADKVLGTVVVRKVAVERLIAIASIAEQDGDLELE